MRLNHNAEYPTCINFPFILTGRVQDSSYVRFACFIFIISYLIRENVGKSVGSGTTTNYTAL